MISKVLICPQLDKARRAYHKVSRKEQAAREREAHAQGNPDVAIDKQKKIQEERELAQQEAEKVSNTFHPALIFSVLGFFLLNFDCNWCSYVHLLA